MKKLFLILMAICSTFGLAINSNEVELHIPAEGNHCIEHDEVFTLICFENDLYFSTTHLDENNTYGIAKKTDIKCKCKIDGSVYYPVN